MSLTRLKHFAVSSTLLVSLVGGLLHVMPAKVFAGCDPGNPILGIPTWYQYLPCKNDTREFPKKADGGYDPQGIVLIAMAVVVMLMRVAAILAVIFVVVGGIKYTTSQGNPEGLNNAKNTIVFALIGLVLTILASGIVSFIARSVM